MIATCLPVALFRASCTKPKAPLARSLTFMYFSWSARGSLPMPGGAIVMCARMRGLASGGLKEKEGESAGARERARECEKLQTSASAFDRDVIFFSADVPLSLHSSFFLSSMPEGEDRAEPAAPAAGAPAAPAAAAPSGEPGPSSTAAAAAAQINRPSNKRRRNLRQTRVTAGDDDNDGGDKDNNADEERGKKASGGPPIDHATLIEDTRALQKQRSKRTVGL